VKSTETASNPDTVDPPSLVPGARKKQRTVKAVKPETTVAETVDIPSLVPGAPKKPHNVPVPLKGQRGKIEGQCWLSIDSDSSVPDIPVALNLALDIKDDPESSVAEDESDAPGNHSDASDQSADVSDSDAQCDMTLLVSEKPMIARKQRLDEVG
jgi:hypothetical protein